MLDIMYNIFMHRIFCNGICGVFLPLFKEMLMSKGTIGHSYISIKERSRILLDGVSNIEAFDDKYIMLEIGENRVSIEGEGMKIQSLSKDGGEIEITGKINGLFYENQKPLGRFRSLFK